MNPGVGKRLGLRDGSSKLELEHWKENRNSVLTKEQQFTTEQARRGRKEREVDQCLLITSVWV